VTRITGDAKLMAHNIEQHEAFLPGLAALKTYVTACLDPAEPETFSGKKYQEIVQAFAPILSEHLADEIKTLRALDACGADAAKLKAEFLIFDAKMREGEKVRTPGPP